MGVLSQRHLWNVVDIKRGLHKLGQVHWCVVILKLNRPQFLGEYGELHHADVSMLLNKNAGTQFGPVQRTDGVGHLLL
jgi:hypothetical protein